MTKVIQTVLILGAVAVGLCLANPAKLNKVRTAKNRFLARQEVTDEDIPAQTPYPPAGIRPEVPFELPTEEKLVAPVNHYLPPLTDPAMFYSASESGEVSGPPAKTYGPPDVSNQDGIGQSTTELPSEETQTEEVRTEEAITEGSDSVEQTVEESQEAAEDENNAEPSEVEEDNFIPERLILTKSKITQKASKLKQSVPQYYLINGSLYIAA